MTFTYSQALDYLYSFTDYEVKPEYRYAPEVIDPTRPRRLLALLGNPHRAYPTIHIAGTKGKGSVAAICASALRVAGFRTGLYVSPHLQVFTERIQVDGMQIGQDELAALVEEITPVLAQVPGITTFEVITALGFLYFSRRSVEVAVIEVGLGGRLDATNVVSPLVSVITSLSLDHTHLLGNTLVEIAAEKGGIIKAGIPVVSASQPEDAMAVLTRISAERGAPLTAVGRDWWAERGEMRLEGQTFRVGRSGEDGDSFYLPLLGKHQVLNATVALAALAIVKEHLPALDDRAISRGLAEVEWPGRFQILQRRPIVVVDGAHNVESVQDLCLTLGELFPDRRRIFVFGATADKDVANMVGVVAGFVADRDEVIVTAATHPRAATPADLGKHCASHGLEVAFEAPDVPSAVARARAMAGPDDVICITGSLFVVGDALGVWDDELAYSMGAR